MPTPVRRAYNLAAAIVTFVASATAGAAVHDVHTHRFDNGLTLHVAPGHAAPVAAIQAWVGVGSADEMSAQAGVAHVVEHMLFKGSSAYGLGELTRAIESGGGEINAWTAFDHTVYHAILGRDHLDGAIDAVGDTLLSPRFDPDDLARERQIILEEIRQGADDPARSVAQQLFATAFVAHPYRRPVIGTADSVQRIGARELVEFFRTFYVADNLTLVVTGDVDPERVRAGVQRRFRTMPSGRPPRQAPAEPRQTTPRTTAVHRAVAEAYLAVGFHVPEARHPDFAALDVAAILLGQSESARLPRRLRDRDQIATSAYANVHALRDPGLFVLSGTADPAHAADTVIGLVAQARELAQELTPDELDKARITAESAFVRQLETAQGRARSLGWHATVSGDPQFGHVYLDRIRGVRIHDVATVLRRTLRADNASVAAILPTPRTTTRRPARGTGPFERTVEREVKASLATQPAVASTSERRVVLPGGVVLLVRRDPSVPVVAMRAVWKGGQRAEDKRSAGATTLLARMITRGCGVRSATEVASEVDRLGGSLAGVSGRNSFGIAAEWLSRTWQPGFELLADCILSPSMPSRDLTRERRLLLDDQQVQAHQPAQIAFRAFNEALYGEHPYGRDALGTPEAVGDLTRAKLLAFYAERYPPSALTLSIVGDVEIDVVVAAVRRRFAGVRGPRAVDAVAAARSSFDGKPTHEREVYRTLDRQQSHLVVGFPGATVDAPDRFALEVLVAILSGQSGRLFAELRERQALVYRVSAHSVEGLDPGFVAVYLSCAPEKIGPALVAVRGVLARLRTHGPTEDEVERARAHLIGSHQISMQRRSAIANAIAYHEAYGLGWQTWAAYADAIRAVRAEDVAAAARAYLVSDREIVATVQPPMATPAAIERSRAGKPRPTRRSTKRRTK